RTANVGEDVGHAHLVEVVVVAAQESGAELAFGATVDVDYHGPPAGELGGRLVKESRDGAAVEAAPVNQLCVLERLRIQTARLALGPAVYFAGPGIQGIDVRRRL